VSFSYQFLVRLSWYLVNSASTCEVNSAAEPEMSFESEMLLHMPSIKVGLFLR